MLFVSIRQTLRKVAGRKLRNYAALPWKKVARTGNPFLFVFDRFCFHSRIFQET
jgi:hypothetical protein